MADSVESCLAKGYDGDVFKESAVLLGTALWLCVLFKDEG